MLASRRADELGDGHVVGVGGAEIALKQPGEPAQEAQDRRVVEMHRGAQPGDGLVGRRLPEQDLRDVARQHRGGGEDHEADDQQRDERQPEPAEHQ